VAPRARLRPRPGMKASSDGKVGDFLSGSRKLQESSKSREKLLEACGVTNTHDRRQPASPPPARPFAQSPFPRPQPSLALFRCSASGCAQTSRRSRRTESGRCRPVPAARFRPARAKGDAPRWSAAGAATLSPFCCAPSSPLRPHCGPLQEATASAAKKAVGALANRRRGLDKIEAVRAVSGVIGLKAATGEGGRRDSRRAKASVGGPRGAWVVRS